MKRMVNDVKDICVASRAKDLPRKCISCRLGPRLRADDKKRKRTGGT